MRPRLVAALAGVALATACGGGSSAGAPAARTPPDLAAFLRLPVATPTSCPANANGTTVGRRSPWAGHVDVSVFLTDKASATVIRRLGRSLQKTTGIQTVYYESRTEAYEEFQRLYTCSANYPRNTVPASYRLVLDPLTHVDRDALLRRIRSMPGVAGISCDPSDPCTAIAGR